VERGLLVSTFVLFKGSTCTDKDEVWNLGPSWPNDGEIDITEGTWIYIETLGIWPGARIELRQ
jgi:hypothetical protein